MRHKRASKLERKRPLSPIVLTDRDRDIILALHKYRFLTTDHIQTLTGSQSRWALNARLRLLYDHKYVDRPKAQYAIFAYADKRPIVYALGNKGADTLSTRYGLKMPSSVYWTEKNRRVRERHIEHSLGISDFMVDVETLCRDTAHLEFIDPDAVLARCPIQTQRSRYPFRWKTHIRHHGHHKDIAVVPDFVFGIRSPYGPGTFKERFFFVEIDRGTMPITRKDISQTSFLRKVLSYADTFEQSIAKRRFGMDGFQVLTLTTSEKRISAIRAAIDSLENRSFSANTFLFKSKDTRQAHFPFHSGWQNAKGKPADIL